ncbi:MAG: DUF4197 family protein [Solirubrobacteraceae bacterium]
MKIINSILFVSLIIFTSCTTGKNTITSTLTPKSQVENLLNTGANSAYSIFGNSTDFLSNALIEAVMPQGLKDINTKLSQLGLNSVVEKQKEIIGKVALTSLTTLKPLISNAIKNITPTDAITILSGEKGAATNFLRQKTEVQLIKNLTPIVSNELNKLGLTKIMNSATGGNSTAINKIIGTLLNSKTNENATNQLDNLVTNQLVNGLYNVVLDSEKNNNLISNGINSILKGLK